MADAALHSVQAAGQQLFRKAGAAAKALPKQEPTVSVKRAVEEGEEPDLAAVPSTASPASTTGSSHEFQAAAAQPLPGAQATRASSAVAHPHRPLLGNANEFSP